MPGMSRTTGRTVADDMAHIRQSIADIVTTPIGTRVMRRGYGCYLFDLVDAPANRVGALRLIASIADALARWEPRVRFKSARVAPAGDGRATVTVHAVLKATGAPIAADVVIGGGA